MSHQDIYEALDAAVARSTPLMGPSPAEQVRDKLRRGGPEAEAFVRNVMADSPDGLRVLYHWRFWARPKQLAPPGDWWLWILLAGRRFGKTRAGAEWVRARVESGEARSIGIIGPTYQEVRRYMVGGYKRGRGGSGLLDVCPPWCMPSWHKNDGELRWPNGAVAYCMTGEDSELRGYGLDTLWGDELPLWRRGPELWANAELTMSERNAGVRPRGLVTTTTRPTELMRRLIMDDDSIVIVGHSDENAPNLSEAWLRRMRKKLTGTEFGRQELEAGWVEAGRGTLWALQTIERFRVSIPAPIRRAIVAVDPAGGGADPIGIVAVGVDLQGHLYVLDDETRRAPPEQWGHSVVELCERHKADVLVERNKFGDLGASNIRGAFRAAKKREPLIHEVNAGDSKEGRAAPIAAAYTRGEVHHVGRLARLEDEMTQWVPGSGRSPNGVDALCHAATMLLGLDQLRAPGDVRQGLAKAAAASWGAPPRKI